MCIFVWLKWERLASLGFNALFFVSDDILWFKPVELKTKWGRRGHIKEALGEKIEKKNLQ